MNSLGENQSLIGWLMAGEIELVLEEVGFNSYFNEHEIDKIRVLMQRVNNQEQLFRLRQEISGRF